MLVDAAVELWAAVSPVLDRMTDYADLASPDQVADRPRHTADHVGMHHAADEMQPAAGWPHPAPAHAAPILCPAVESYPSPFPVVSFPTAFLAHSGGSAKRCR